MRIKGLGNNSARRCLESWNAAMGVDEGKWVCEVRMLLHSNSSRPIAEEVTEYFSGNAINDHHT